MIEGGLWVLFLFVLITELITEKEVNELNIQWYPGHMTKAKRMMLENLKLVDIIVELLDARIPISSRNPDIDKLVGNKPRIIILNKTDMSDANKNNQWKNYFNKQGHAVVFVNSINGKGIKDVVLKAKELMQEKVQRDLERGRVNRPIRAMVVGIPNVGKSTFINKLVGKSSAKTGDKPGVTKGKQWIKMKDGLELLDTPGILWPKFEDPNVGLKLAFTGAIKDQILDVETLALKLIEILKDITPESLKERYKIADLPEEALDIYKLIGKNRGFLIAGGEIDYSRTANILLDEFRSCKIGHITLEIPEDI